MQPLAYEYILAIGLGLIAIELMFFSFYLLPLGLGFLVVGGIVFLDSSIFGNLFIQIAVSFLFGIVFILIMRQRFLAWLGKSSTSKEEIVHQNGIGEIDGEQIKFAGTFWATTSDLSKYKSGDKVNITIENSMAVVDKPYDI